MSDKLQLHLSQEFVLTAIQLMYSGWASEFSALTQVKQQKDDGSKNWSLNHAKRLRNHTRREAAWRALREEGFAIIRSGAFDNGEPT